MHSRRISTSVLSGLALLLTASVCFARPHETVSKAVARLHAVKERKVLFPDELADPKFGAAHSEELARFSPFHVEHLYRLPGAQTRFAAVANDGRRRVLRIFEGWPSSATAAPGYALASLPDSEKPPSDALFSAIATGRAVMRVSACNSDGTASNLVATFGRARYSIVTSGFGALATQFDSSTSFSPGLSETDEPSILEAQTLLSPFETLATDHPEDVELAGLLQQLHQRASNKPCLTPKTVLATPDGVQADAPREALDAMPGVKWKAGGLSLLKGTFAGDVNRVAEARVSGGKLRMFNVNERGHDTSLRPRFKQASADLSARYGESSTHFVSRSTNAQTDVLTWSDPVSGTNLSMKLTCTDGLCVYQQSLTASVPTVVASAH